MSIDLNARVRTPKAIRLGDLALQTNTNVVGDPDTLITGVGAIGSAKAGEITFLSEKKYRHFLPTLAASAVILPAEEAADCTIPALIAADPKLVFAQIVAILYPHQTVEPAVHPTAVIGKTSQIHPNAHIGAHCVIGERVTIGANVVLQAGCHVADDCSIGEGTVLYPHVSIYHSTTIGNNCVLHSGVVIGSDGFGFAKNKEKWFKVPQIGGVKIGDRVDIGANTTIDRGAIDDTEIGNDVILDNLIQIGHNVKIGDGTAIAACCGIAGSAIIGKHCLIAGGSRVNGHINICDFVVIIGCSNVGQSITKPGAYASAITTMEMKLWKKNLVRFHQLDSLALRLFNVEKKLNHVELIK